MRSSVASLFIVLLFVAGCATDNRRPIPIAGGKFVPIAFGPSGPEPGKANGYEVEYAASVPGADKTQLIYKFAFKAPPNAKLSRVIVDDISDEQSASLLDDQKPWLDDNNWKGETKPFNVKDPLLKWAYTVTPSMRVYRFTITDSAGQKSVMYQVTGYPEFMKAAMRFSWGEKY